MKLGETMTAWLLKCKTTIGFIDRGSHYEPWNHSWTILGHFISSLVMFTGILRTMFHFKTVQPSLNKTWSSHYCTLNLSEIHEGFYKPWYLPRPVLAPIKITYVVQFNFCIFLIFVSSFDSLALPNDRLGDDIQRKGVTM